jgi:hypothetical protein
MNKQIKEPEIEWAIGIDLLINIKRKKGNLPPSYLGKQSIDADRPVNLKIIKGPDTIQRIGIGKEYCRR